MSEFSFNNDEYRLKVLDRLSTWKNVAEEIIAKYQDKFQIDIWFLNHELLFLAATSYADDIYKFKYYTDSKLASRFKIASYSLKWIGRFKPIQVISKNDKAVGKAEILINNLLAINCAFAALNVPNDELVKYSDVVRQLNYNLLYRTISGKSLALTFELYEELVKTNMKKTG